MTDIFVVIYLDDILIFSNSLEEHRVHVRHILECLHEYDLHLKPEKCLFHMQKIEFLGFMVTPTGISMDTAKTKAVSIWPTPSNLKAVQAFLGFANFYRRFIAGFSDIVIPLIRLTRKDTPFTWGPDHTKQLWVGIQPVPSSHNLYLTQTCGLACLQLPTWHLGLPNDTHGPSGPPHMVHCQSGCLARTPWIGVHHQALMP